MTTWGERIRGGLYGLLVGDALGVPYEFRPPEALPPAPDIEMEPPAGFSAVHPVPPGTWSDDGAQALALLDSLLTHGRLDPDDLADRLVRWATAGDYAVDGVVFDIGHTTRRAIQGISEGNPALSSGPDGEMDNGNGALMRVLPLALWHRGDDASLVQDARDQSRVTHGHLRSQLCCAAYCLWARRMLAGQDADRAFEDAIEGVRLWAGGEPEALAEIEDHLVPGPPGGPSGSGYVVDSLHSARVALRAGDFEAVAKRAVAFGWDTDTTACIAAGLAGVRDGVDAIPARWRRALRGEAEIARPLVERLAARG